MLAHPWLAMGDNYQTRMSDLEFEKFQLKQTTLLQMQEECGSNETLAFTQTDDGNIGQLIKSDDELVEADLEDNLSFEFDSDDSLSLTGEKNEEHEAEEFNLNVSFTGGYLPNTDLSRFDKKQNAPQFQSFEVRI